MTRARLATLNGSGLLDVERAAALIRECKEVEQLVDLRDQARAIEVLQRRRKAGLDCQIDATEIAIRAERRLGEIVREVPKSKGGRPSKSGDTESPVLTLADMGITKKESSRWQALAAVPEDTFGDHIAHVRNLGIKLTTRGTIAAASGAGDYDGDEYYTPERYIDAAREVMGGIDIDPASCAFAQRIVRARIFYSAADDGLAQQWDGRIWLNPPYSQPLATRFAEKLIEEIESRRCRQAIVLQNASTGTKWFHELASRSTTCLHLGRVGFIAPDGSVLSNNRYEQAFFYFGPRRERFAKVFSQFGLVGELRRAA